MCARMYARMYDSGQIVIRTQDRHTSGTHDHRKREEHRTPAEKPEYICIIADNEKKVQKKLKKICK